MLTIGLTGGIASGKSTVSHYFSQLGITIIDADEVARDVVSVGQPALEDLTHHFGPTILNDNGTLNRKKLRNIIFDDDNERQWVERLLHPIIRKKMKESIGQATSPYCIMAIPLIVESQPNPLLDRILVVDCPKELQIQRVQMRDNISNDDAIKIVNAQATREERLAIADDVIENSSNEEQLKEDVDRLHQHYLELAKKM